MSNASRRRVVRDAHRRWIAIADMRVSPVAQRDLNQEWVNKIIAEFDLEELGEPTVNLRDGAWYVIDGQHRVEALKGMGWGDQQMQCQAYEGLSEAEEAEKFLKLNNKLTVNALAKFRTGVTAGREEENEISAIVAAEGLSIGNANSPGTLRAIGTLRRVYHRDPETLRRTLRILHESWGDTGLEAPLIDGVGLVVHRYNGMLDDARAIAALSRAPGGTSGLLSRAEQLRRQTANSRSQCVAAAVVDVLNRRPGRKLPTWWRTAPLAVATDVS